MGERLLIANNLNQLFLLVNQDYVLDSVVAFARQSIMHYVHKCWQKIILLPSNWQKIIVLHPEDIVECTGGDVLSPSQ
jgi:hypothetical protein